MSSSRALSSFEVKNGELFLANVRFPANDFQKRRFERNASPLITSETLYQLS